VARLRAEVYRWLMEPEWLKVLLFWGACAVIAAGIKCTPLWRAVRKRLRAHDRFGRRVEVPDSRPIEAIAQDVRRLGRRFREPPRGVSFVKFEGTRRAYDEVLAEGCRVLGIEHLLGVLPPGAELDAERRRVELRMYLAGFRLDDAA
jgi:hypothetical protein